MINSGVGTRFLPPPKVGQILVKKSCKCAAISPVPWIFAARGPAITNVMRSMAYGIHCAGIVITKKVAFMPRSSCVDVYAKANTSADVNTTPPAMKTFRP